MVNGIPQIRGYPYELRINEVNRRRRAERSVYRRSKARTGRRKPPNRAE